MESKRTNRVVFLASDGEEEKINKLSDVYISDSSLYDNRSDVIRKILLDAYDRTFPIEVR